MKLCHRGKRIIEVTSKWELKKHLRHGDRKGKCKRRHRKHDDDDRSGGKHARKG
jgi:hypothetical protein